jgi:hypothetical protein
MNKDVEAVRVISEQSLRIVEEKDPFSSDPDEEARQVMIAAFVITQLAAKFRIDIEDLGKSMKPLQKDLDALNEFAKKTTGKDAFEIYEEMHGKESK